MIRNLAYWIKYLFCNAFSEKGKTTYLVPNFLKDLGLYQVMYLLPGDV